MPDAILLDKFEAATRLGLSTRRVLRLIQEGRLNSTEGTRGGQTIKLVDANSIDQYLQSLKTVAGESKELQPAADNAVTPRFDWQRLLEKLAMPEDPTPQWLNLDESAARVGLSRKLLLSLILSGELPARQEHVKRDRWRIHRADLDALRGTLVK